MRKKISFILLTIMLTIIVSSILIACDKDSNKNAPEDASYMNSLIVGKWEGKSINNYDDETITGHIGFEFNSNGFGSILVEDDEWIDVLFGKYTISGYRIILVGINDEEDKVEVNFKISYLTNEKLVGSYNIYLPDYEAEEDIWLGVDLSKVEKFSWE